MGAGACIMLTCASVAISSSVLLCTCMILHDSLNSKRWAVRCVSSRSAMEKQRASWLIDRGGRWRATAAGSGSWYVWLERRQWETRAELQRRAEEQATIDGQFGTVTIEFVSQSEDVRERWGDAAAARMAELVAEEYVEEERAAAMAAEEVAIDRVKLDQWHRTAQGEEALSNAAYEDYRRAEGYDFSAAAARSEAYVQAVTDEVAAEALRESQVRETVEWTRRWEETMAEEAAPGLRLFEERQAIAWAEAETRARAAESEAAAEAEADDAYTPTVFDSDTSSVGAIVQVLCTAHLATGMSPEARLAG